MTGIIAGISQKHKFLAVSRKKAEDVIIEHEQLRERRLNFAVQMPFQFEKSTFTIKTENESILCVMTSGNK